ncbi:MAG: hypothetical protein A3B86_02790 [Candidatus Yanofskybacteria bacterium RIFCSPHIGHO2_02_FULL_38_22b]|uniref:NAD-dependent epimerase/dehydratase domain-containing protein n=1 Tax=Candidatus Yanofskybacteria bacterium RIFCSPHIGHO2_02_FULL_38_22b TaxID=1802673 RepID=A0A1F8F3S3_9BACT|nr:MAG: hypothetical protein A2816_03065 [Candidatus Yanofskybacteria bacterium RIFCSPHIGHO2_01_FULL_39_44]OGN07782.1 MAG: hypothetical protein A3B86_02790 [Candidatus Yanofskybacteria bacterium RIFCSPHIGHO2_02_FULL_38_22b]OGN20665.1 MAG: hypothetical protein A2910_02625 [Candidatus Yanofskybacteria bacterium RIFCSPLOWO2_01_FULL_39_28]
MNKAKILISGTSSGLGRYLVKELGAVPFQRIDPLEIVRHKNTFYDCIIHCATDARNSITSDELLTYYQSHIELTKQLLQIPHHLFVFISSSAVYPDLYRLNSESDIITLPHDPPLYGLYGLFKLLTEKMVSQNTRSSLILRCVTIVGPTSRPTNIARILRNDPTQLTLSTESSFNLVSMSQIKEFIELALTQNITGIFNAGSTQNATLGEIAKAVGSQPKFGNFTFNVPQMDTRKIREISIDFNKSTLEIAKIEAERLSTKEV